MLSAQLNPLSSEWQVNFLFLLLNYKLSTLHLLNGSYSIYLHACIIMWKLLNTICSCHHSLRNNGFHLLASSYCNTAVIETTGCHKSTNQVMMKFVLDQSSLFFMSRGFSHSHFLDRVFSFTLQVFCFLNIFLFLSLFSLSLSLSSFSDANDESFSSWVMSTRIILLSSFDLPVRSFLFDLHGSIKKPYLVVEVPFSTKCSLELPFHYLSLIRYSLLQIMKGTNSVKKLEQKD